MNNSFEGTEFPSAAFVANEMPRAEPVTAETHASPVAVHDGDVIDSQQACDILGVNANHLRQMAFQKTLVPVGRNGHRSLFSRSAVMALASKRSARLERLKK